jgi:DNA polymerase-3 subunit chi
MLVSFLPAPNNRTKLASICQTIHYHFQKKEPILIKVPTEEAAKYIDALLWKYPEESFMPHVRSEVPVQECVVITCSKENLNQAAILLHLCPTVHPSPQQFSYIYDLYDETDEDKHQASEARKKYYMELGYPINFIVENQPMF